MASPLPSTSSTNGGPALELDAISKSYGATRALTSVSLTVGQGEVVGLLGPNGAGKSTAMKTILGIIRPDAGRTLVFGRDVQQEGAAVRRDIGYVPETPSLYEFLTGAEYLDFVADMYDLPAATRRERIQPFLDGLELVGHENSLISSYSQGMRQKVALIAGLLHHPRLMILDEPLNGLDPRAARVVKDVLRDRATRDRAGVLFSTHVLEIAQAMCDRLVILDHGAVLATGTVGALRDRAGLAGSGLEEVFLALTGTGDLGEVVAALGR
jgi:ABC-2 type transport system ATP-binding protein